MSRLEIKRLDSPLARSTRQPTDPADDERPQEDQRQATSRSKRRPTAERSKPRLASVPQASPDATAASADSLEGLPDPPALNESLELLSTRLPTVLRRSLSELTGALRTRNGERVSRRACPSKRSSPSSSGSRALRRTRRPSPGSEPRSTHTAPGATPQPPKRYGHRRRPASRPNAPHHDHPPGARKLPKQPSGRRRLYHVHGRVSAPADHPQAVRLAALPREELKKHVAIIDLLDALDTAPDRLPVVPTFAAISAQLGVDLVGQLQDRPLVRRPLPERAKSRMRLQEQPQPLADTRPQTALHRPVQPRAQTACAEDARSASRRCRSRASHLSARRARPRTRAGCPAAPGAALRNGCA